MRLNRLTGLVSSKLSRISVLRAYASSNYTPPTSSWGTIPINAISFDIGGYFNTSLYRWTPPRGYFIVYLDCTWRETNTAHHHGRLLVNGSFATESTLRENNSWHQSKGCMIMGKTDGSLYVSAQSNKDTSSNAYLDSCVLYGICIPERMV